MSRLVVVSNRVADPRKTAAGGLAVALAEVLNNSGGLWFGWSGKLVEAPAGTETPVKVHQAGPVALATMDLTRPDYDASTSATPTACCGRCSITGWTWPTSTPATSRATGA
jgi:trehalose 6-phosphate synthase